VTEQSPPYDRGQAVLLSVWDDGEAVLIRQLLESYGIPCQTSSEISHRVLPIAIDGLGEIRIIVPAAMLRDAQHVLAEHRRQGMRLIRGGKSPRRDVAPRRAEAAGPA
jgi:hypothetical protein